MVNKPDLSQTLFGLRFKNPVLAASGTYGYGEDFKDFYEPSSLGGFVTKAVTPEPREGNPSPRVIETPSGMLNAIGLQNDGLQEFCERIIPGLESIETNVIVNVAGKSTEDYLEVCDTLERYEVVKAFEINISCPNVKAGCALFGSDPVVASELVGELKATTKKPLIIKLTPNVTDIASIALAVESAGADAVSLINTLTGMVIDVEKRMPMLANFTGGLSGPAVRPIAVRMVWEVSKAVKIPVIGMGGIFSARDAIEFIIAGASLVQTGCGMFVKPKLPLEVIRGIETYLSGHSMDNLGQLIGTLQPREVE